jgi:hypothetical protein
MVCGMGEMELPFPSLRMVISECLPSPSCYAQVQVQSVTRTRKAVVRSEGPGRPLETRKKDDWVGRAKIA